MLLATHVLLWVLGDDQRFGSQTRRMLAAAQLLQASTVALWEVAIKSDLGKLAIPDDFTTRVAESGIEWLDLSPDHVLAGRQVQGLPHRDPFDEMMVAVTVSLGSPLVTADRALLAASVSPSIELLDARR